MKKTITAIVGIVVVGGIFFVDKYISKPKNNITTENQYIPTKYVEQQREDFLDHVVFVDGSVPTTWDVAGITDPIAFKEFLILLQSAVINRDKEAVIAVVDTRIGTKEYVRKNYDSLFNQKVEGAFKVINIHEIFRNYQGVMIGNGTVWFQQNQDGTFSIFAINNK